MPIGETATFNRRGVLILKVNEIFKSIQGESTYAGLPCTFIRLSGCNLRCSYCDTTYAYGEGVYMDATEIYRTVGNYGLVLVCLTGGEPLLQDDSPELVGGLIRKGHSVTVETNGSLRIDCLPEGAVKIMDVKCPDSGMSHKMYWDNISLLRPSDEVKFIISSRRDYDWAKDVISAYGLVGRVKLLFGVAFGRLEAETLAQWMLEDRLNIRLQLQLHKYIWGLEVTEGTRTKGNV